MRPRTGDEGVANTSGGEAPPLRFAPARRAENAKHVPDPGYKTCTTNVVVGIGDAGIQGRNFD
jgi:hypothetical protein